MEKPPISAEDFGRLELRVGTVLTARVHEVLPGLSVVTVRLDASIEALAPTPSLPAGLVGRQVVVAGPLYPLTAGAESYRYSLLADHAPSSKVLVTGNKLPDGGRLY